MHLNSKRRLGIKYIMVQLPENLDESIVKSDSRAKKTLHNAISFLDTPYYLRDWQGAHPSCGGEDRG